MNTVDKIRNAILGKYPLVYLLTWEENRALQILEAFAVKLFGGPDSFHVWSAVSGFGTDQKEPLSALRLILESDKKGIFVLKDFSNYIQDPAITRSLRDAYYSLQARDCFVFIVSPELNIPESLKKEVLLIDMDLPDENEIVKHIRKVQQNYPQQSLDESVVQQMAFALRGLTLNEAGHIVHRILRAKKTDVRDILKRNLF